MVPVVPWSMATTYFAMRHLFGDASRGRLGARRRRSRSRSTSMPTRWRLRGSTTKRAPPPSRPAMRRAPATRHRAVAGRRRRPAPGSAPAAGARRRGPGRRAARPRRGAGPSPCRGSAARASGSPTSEPPPLGICGRKRATGVAPASQPASLPERLQLERRGEQREPVDPVRGSRRPACRRPARPSTSRRRACAGSPPARPGPRAPRPPSRARRIRDEGLGALVAGQDRARGSGPRRGPAGRPRGAARRGCR